MSTPRQTLMNVITKLIDAVMKDNPQYALFKPIINGYLQSFLSTISDEEALKFLVILESVVCDGRGRTHRRVRKGNE